MLRVVLDTNVRYSSAIHGGRPRDVDIHCEAPRAIQLISGPMLDELQRILGRGLQAPALAIEMHRVRQRSLEIATSLRLEVCRDPDDNRVLECAVAGKADLIVTGDRDLLVLKSFETISIVTVRQFLDHYVHPHNRLP